MSQPFEDEFSQARGSTFTIIVDPIFKERITEAAAFISRSKPSNERAAFVNEMSERATQATPAAVPETEEAEQESDDDDDDEEKTAATKGNPVESDEILLEKRKVILDLVDHLTNGPLEGTDREVEGFTNLILSLILASFTTEDDEYSTLILILVDILAQNSQRSINPSNTTRYTSLATVFNSLPQPNKIVFNNVAATLRLAIVLKLISYAASNDDFNIIKPVLEQFEAWLVEWGFGYGSHGEEEGNAAVTTVLQALTSKGKTLEARSLLLSHLSTPSIVVDTAFTPSASASLLASHFIVLSLGQVDFFDFASLSALPAVASPSTPALSTLLTIFQSGDVAAFDAFASSNAAVLEEYALDQSVLKKKLKLLALAELCSGRVGDNVSYAEMAKTLNLVAEGKGDDGEEVEIWVIDAIRATLISGRLSQPLSSFHVTRAAPRSFTPAHWSQLQTRLEGWQTSLNAILESVVKGTIASAEPNANGVANAIEARRESSVAAVVEEGQTVAV